MTEGPPGPHVICAGRLYADLVFTGLPRLPSLGTEIYADGLGVYPGGGAVITAAYLVAAGCSADLLTMLPAKPFGDALTPQIAARNVGLRYAAPAMAGCDAQITVAIATQGDRAFLTRRAGPALPEDALITLSASGAQHLHIAELATLLEHPDLITTARAAGMTVSLDCAWDDAAFQMDLASLIGSVDVFFPNEAEAGALTKAGITMPAAPLTVIKQGASGAAAITSQGRWQVAAEPADVIDATGAGDAFDGGFLAAWLSGAEPKACLRAGVRAGARAVSAPGGLGGLTKQARPAPNQSL